MRALRLLLLLLILGSGFDMPTLLYGQVDTNGLLTPPSTLLPIDPPQPPAVAAPAPVTINTAPTMALPTGTTAPSTAPTNTPANLTPLENKVRPAITRVTSGSGTLPNGQGQIWREYDITTYSQNSPNVKKPEAVIVDWILRETGYESWHGDIPCLLNADSRTLRVYHTPEMQKIVGEIVDRFVNPDTTGESYGLRLISIASPAWRARALTVLKSIPSQTPGVQAWGIAKEDAALLVNELRKRTDYREHSNPQIFAVHGQTLKTASLRPRTFVQGFQVQQELWQGPLPLNNKIDEGYTFEFTPVLSIDGKTVEATMRCDIDQVEKMHSVPLDIPNVNGARVNLEVPQLSAQRLQERFRWPSNQILVIGLGMIPTPTPTDSTGGFLPLVSTAPPRVDLLLVVEPRGKVNANPTVQRATPTPLR
jgi:hypothetical protein